MGNGGHFDTRGFAQDCPQGIAIDLADGKPYWAATGQGVGTEIDFANLNESGDAHHLKTTGATAPDGPVSVAINPATGKIYWDNYGNGILSFAKLNDTGGGGDLSTTGATASGGGFGVVVDPATHRIYWTNRPGDKISFANLNGTGGGDLNTSRATVDDPEGVAIDPLNGKIYWANFDDNTHPISFADLNDTGGGGNLNVTGATPGDASGVAVDPETGKLYWANFGVGTISFANLNDTGGGGQLDTAGVRGGGSTLPVLLKAPRANASPKISGGAKVGSKLSCSRGTWAPDLLESFLYQRPAGYRYSWSRNGQTISSANSGSITASSAGAYTCTVTARNYAGTTKSTSSPHQVTT